MKNPKELHQEFVKLGRERYRLMNRLLLILPGIYKSEIWKRYAADIYKYAGRFGGISKSAVDKRLGLEKHLEDKPQLREAIEKVGINKVVLVATLATPENEAVFADKALNMSKSALVTLSKELRGKNVESISLCHAKPQTITIELDEEMTFLFLKLKNKFKKLNNREVMRRILEEADERTHKVSFAKKAGVVKPLVITDDRVDPATGEVVISDGIGDSITGDEIIRNASPRESVLSSAEIIAVAPAGALTECVDPATGDSITGDEPRTIKAKRKKQTLGNGKCSYPGCNKPAENIHHPDRYGKTKNHNKLVALCKDHHEFMHNGLIENEQLPSQNWTMNIYKTPDTIDQLYRKCRQESLL